MKVRASKPLRFLDEQALLNVLWPALEAFVNGAEPSQAISPDDPAGDPEVGRLATDEEEMGPWEWRNIRALLSLLARGGREPLPDHNPKDEWEARREGELAASAPRAPLALGPKGWLVVRAVSRREQLQHFAFTIALLRLPALRPLLRQCDQCGRFQLGNRAHRRPRTFCSDNCRFAFHRARRTPKAHREYMKGYRRNAARQRALRRKRDRKGTK
jgi:hypothetical protein